MPEVKTIQHARRSLAQRDRQAIGGDQLKRRKEQLEPAVLDGERVDDLVRPQRLLA
jgi:hypothetical protein